MTLKTRFAIAVAFCLVMSIPTFAGIIYSNGPISASFTAGADYIGYPPGWGGEYFSDGFIATTSGVAISFDFGEWTPVDTTPTSLTWALGTSAFGSDIATGTLSQVSYAFDTELIGTGQNAGLNYDVYLVSVDISAASPSLVAGDTYYLTLSHGGSSDGAWNASWDVNDGSASCYGFQVANTPQTASCGAYTVGPAAGSNSFTIYDATPTPEPGSALLLGSGLIGLAGALLRRQSRKR
jgi:hypothetical protein